MTTNPISPHKIKDVNDRLEALGVSVEELKEEFIKGSGAGGQKINKTSSCVQLTDVTTGIVIKCQQSRSREQNRFFARRLLLEKLENIVLGKESAKARKEHKIKARKKRRSRRSKEKLLADKKINAQQKALRKKPSALE